MVVQVGVLRPRLYRTDRGYLLNTWRGRTIERRKLAGNTRWLFESRLNPLLDSALVGWSRRQAGTGGRGFDGVNPEEGT